MILMKYIDRKYLSPIQKTLETIILHVVVQNEILSCKYGVQITSGEIRMWFLSCRIIFDTIRILRHVQY